MKNYLLICMALIAVLCVSSVFAQTRTPKVETSVVATLSDAALQDAYPDQTRAPWDLLWAFNVDVVQGTYANFAPFLWGDKLYVTKWNVTNGVAHRFARSGSTWVTDGSITITGLTYDGFNAEGFCTDGEFLYCCTGGPNIFRINPATWAATLLCNVPGASIDALAYDEDNDCFWIATYNTTTVRRVNRSGAVQQTLTAGMVVSDLAWEKTSDGTPYLWTLCNTTGQKNLHRFNLTTNQFQANAQSTAGVPNIANAGGGAGLFTGYDPVLEKMVLIGILEGDNDVAFCFELGDGGTGGDDCPAVTNVTATQFEANKVKVNWTAATGDVANYKIYQDNVEKATVAAGTTTWTSDALANGTYTYAVAATYADDCIPVKVAAAPIEIKTCSGVVSNLEVAYAADCGKATITWDAAAKSRAYADAYVLNTFQTGDYSSIILETGAKTLVGPRPTFLADETPTGDDFDGTTLYRITNFGRVFSVAENGTQTLIGTIAGITNCVGLAYDWKNNDGFYFVDINSTNTVFSLHKLSIPSLTKTLIGTAAGTFRRGLALHEDGYLYSLTTSVSATPSNLIRVDPANGQITTVGPIDFPAMYGFDLAYDRVADVLYASPIHFDPAPVGPVHTSKLISLNTTTGAATLIKDYGLLQHATLSYTKGGEPIAPKYNVYRDGEKIAGPIEETTFEDITFDKTKPYTWSVAVACSNGGDGEWTNKSMPACDELPPCDPAVITKVEPSSTGLLVTWTLPTGAQSVNIYCNGVQIQGVFTGTSFLHESLEDGAYCYTITVNCAGGAVSPMSNEECYTLSIKGFVKDGFSILPNPATSNITITAGNAFQTIEVISFLGQTVISQPNTSNTAILDVSNLTNGVYFVRIISENGTSVKKFVKQ